MVMGIFFFIILCDVYLFVMNGLEFKEEIDWRVELCKIVVFFIFYFMIFEVLLVNCVYEELGIYGYFVKELFYSGFK